MTHITLKWIQCTPHNPFSCNTFTLQSEASTCMRSFTTQKFLDTVTWLSLLVVVLSQTFILCLCCSFKLPHHFSFLFSLSPVLKNSPPICGFQVQLRQAHLKVKCLPSLFPPHFKSSSTVAENTQSSPCHSAAIRDKGVGIWVILGSALSLPNATGCTLMKPPQLLLLSGLCFCQVS